MQNGTTYIVRPRIAPSNRRRSVRFIAAGSTQLLSGPAAARVRAQTNVRPSTRAVSDGSERARKQPGRFSGSSRISVPAATISAHSRSYSSREPSHQWMRPGRARRAISSTQAASARCPVRPWFASIAPSPIPFRHRERKRTYRQPGGAVNRSAAASRRPRGRRRPSARPGPKERGRRFAPPPVSGYRSRRSWGVGQRPARENTFEPEQDHAGGGKLPFIGLPLCTRCPGRGAVRDAGAAGSEIYRPAWRTGRGPKAATTRHAAGSRRASVFLPPPAALTPAAGRRWP